MFIKCLSKCLFNGQKWKREKVKPKRKTDNKPKSSVVGQGAKGCHMCGHAHSPRVCVPAT